MEELTLNNGYIDIVIPWVDGQDKDWQKKAMNYMKDFDEKRYRDWDILRYVLRSIEKYSPWVHKVYLVTDNQKPNWLNEDYEKIEVVDHKQIIPEKYLPTFNSNVITLNLYKIPGLSEKFIVMNDDLIFSAPTKCTDFFKGDLPCDFFVENPVLGEIPWHKTVLNGVILINQKFNKRKFMKKHIDKCFSILYGKNNLKTLFSLPYKLYTGFFSDHGPQPYLKRSFETVWKIYKEQLEENNTHRLRQSGEDIPDYIVRYYQLVSGNFNPRKVKNRTMYYPIGKNNFNEINASLKKQKYQSIVLNDDEVIKVDNFDITFKEIHKVLENNFPQKSKFEK